MMTVKELIEKLKEFPQDLPVTTYTERAGYDFIDWVVIRESTGEKKPFEEHPYIGSKHYIGKYVDIGF